MRRVFGKVEMIGRVFGERDWTPLPITPTQVGKLNREDVFFGSAGLTTPDCDLWARHHGPTLCRTDPRCDDDIPSHGAYCTLRANAARLMPPGIRTRGISKLMASAFAYHSPSAPL